TSVEGRPLAEGDFAQVSLDGQPKDGEGQPVHMDDILVEIGGKNTMPEFNENLRGVPAGEERSFDVNYPADSADKRLAGKTFKYTVKVLSIKQKSLPELNDQFAKELGEFANLDEVKQRIREGMEEERKHAAEHEAKDKLEEEKIDVSDEEIDREVEALAKQSKQTSEAIRARLTRDGALDRIRNRIRNEKTLDFLYHQSA